MILFKSTSTLSIVVCHLLRIGVAAIFGPQNSHTASHVQSICDTMEVINYSCTKNIHNGTVTTSHILF